MMNQFHTKILKIIAVTLLLGATSSTVMAKGEKNQPVLPEGTLDASQIERRFSGNTFSALVENKDQTMIFYFDKDSTVTRVRNGWQKDGTWDIRKDGRLCIQLGKGDRDCRIIVKQGDQYRQYAVKQDGNHRYEITYTDPHQGDQLAKMSNEPVLPKGTLKRKAITELFSGHTVESVTASKGRVSKTYYKPDGTLEQSRDGMKRYGKWRVNKNARMCLQMENLEEKCRIIVKEDGEIKKYIVRKNSQHQHSVSYRNITPGKTFK